MTDRLRIGVHLSFPGDDVEQRLRAVPDVDWDKAASPVGLAGMVARADALALGSPSYTAELAQALGGPENRVRWLHFSSAGFDQATKFGVPPGIIVTNSSTAWAGTVAEHAVALLLALCRRLPAMAEDVAARRWARDDYVATLRSLESMRVGILGYGSIGREIGCRLHGFGGEVVALVRRPQETPYATAMSLGAALPTLDALVVTLPLSPATTGMIGPSEIAAMKPGGFLVNVGRGGTVDQVALINALRRSHLAGAALDVFAPEPPAADDDVWRTPNLLVSPHVAGFGGDAGKNRLIELLIENIARFRNGRALLGQVDPARG